MAAGGLVPDIATEVIANKAPGTKVSFASNENVAAAAALAKQSDIAIVFAYQWSSEGMDLKNLRFLKIRSH